MGKGENQLTIYLPNSNALWDLLLAIFGISWVFPVKETDLSCQGSFVGKQCKKAWMVASFAFFWIDWRQTNIIIFNNVNISINREKFSFLL